MDAYLLDLTNLLLRWLHVVAAIAWIGESIYFVMLDNSLRRPQSRDALEKGVAGEMWAVHGGGFYHNQKYLVSPGTLPDDLHWSMWKAYTTWLSGFVLFVALYLHKPDLYLINTASSWQWAAQLSGGQAIALSVAYLVLGWVLYDQLCRRISPDMENDRVLSIAVALMMVLVAWTSTQLFQGRAAYLLTGAVMATAMSANVFFWIIPGQRKMVRAMRAGLPVDPLDGKRGKQRSVHNTYFTLPVVLLMLSNHYSFTYTSPHSWIIMVLFIFSGALIRQYFVLRHSGQNRLLLPAAGILLIVAAGWLAAPPPLRTASAVSGSLQQSLSPDADGSTATTLSESTEPAITNVAAIIQNRCIQCHGSAPSMAGFSTPPLGMAFDTAAEIALHAAAIKHTVANNYMPLGNITKMTPEERDVIRMWQP